MRIWHRLIGGAAAVLTAALVITACGSDEGDPSGFVPPYIPPVPVLVQYVAGEESYSYSGSTANVWKIKGGVVAQTLSFGSGATANALAVSGDDIYAAGWDGYSFFTGSKRTATIWKLTNDTPTSVPLTDGTNHAMANALAARGDDLYAAGYERNANDIDVATIWKLTNSGTPTPVSLTDGTSHAMAYALAARGDDLYAAGFKSNANDNRVATIWKVTNSGAITSIPLGGEWSWSMVYALAVSGDDLYAAGDGTPNGNPGATMWKVTNDGAITPFPLNDGTSDANALAVNGEDLYAAGYAFNDDYKQVAEIWKISNGTVTSPADIPLSSSSVGQSSAQALLLAWE